MPKKSKSFISCLQFLMETKEKKEATAPFYAEWLKHTNLEYVNYTNGSEMLIQKRLSILYEDI